MHVVTSSDSTDDLDLVRAALTGDRQAFVVLVKRYDADTRAVAYATAGPHGPFEDAMQEALIKAYRSLGTFRQGTNFRAWLCRIVHNAAIDQIRRTKKLVPMADVEPTPSTADIGTHVATSIDVAHALQLLPDHLRAAVMLVDVEGYDYPAAADVLGIPRGTVASRVSKARSELRKTLSKDQNQ
jgi:RNA polymerase sigma-70 factor (ECF subfamily)